MAGNRTAKCWSQRATTSHRRFDRIGLDGNVLRQIQVAIQRKHNVVLKADGESFVRKVDAGLDRHHPADGHRGGRGGPVVDVQSKRMTHAVHEIFLQRGMVWILVSNIAWPKQAKLEKFRLDETFTFLLPDLRELPGFETGDGMAQTAQHCVVNLLLAARKFSTYGQGSCDVGVVVRIAGADIEQQEIAAGANLIIAQVVQHAGI